MDQEKILRQVADIICETFGVDGLAVTEATVAADIPGWDSLSHTLLMLTLEQELGVALQGSTVYRNVGDLVAIITEQKRHER